MKRILLCAILAAVLTISLAVGASALGEEMIIATGTPKIDGVIDDVWATADRQQLGYCKAGDLKVDAYTLPEDCTVYASALYDSTALYFLFEITDNEFAFDSSVGDWKNDSIYLYIDEIGDGDPTWTDQQAQIALIPEDGWEMIPRKGAALADYELAYTFPTEGTCIMEFKYVPRELPLKQGSEFTLDFQYNDSIPGGTRDYCLGWSDETDDASNNSACWGFATLGGAGTASAAEPEAPAESGGTKLLSKSWDNIYIDYEQMVNGGADAWLASNPIEGSYIEQLMVRGWAYISTPITAFAYTLDGGDPVKSEDYIVDRPDVKAAISEEAEGFEIEIDVSGLGAGDHLIKVFAVSTNDELIDTTFDLPFKQEEKPAEEPKAEEPAKTEEPAAEPEPTAEEPAPEAPAETPAETPAEKPAETAKSGCGSMIGGSLIVLVTLLGSAWIAKRR